MILWRKRLLVFIIKIAGVILLIATFALFLFYNYFFKKDVMLKFVPQSAVFYSTVRLNNEIKTNQFVANLLRQIDPDFLNYDFDQLNYLINYNSALALIPSADESFGFDYLAVLNFTAKPADFAKELPFIGRYNLQYYWLENKTIGGNFLFLSNSQQVIEHVRNIAAYKEESLAKKFSVAMGLNRINLNNTAKIYLSSPELSEQIKKIQNLPNKLALASILASQANDLFFSLKLNSGNLAIQNFDDELNKEPKTEDLLSLVPNDTIFSLSFDNGANSWLRTADLLKSMDLNTYLAMEKNLADWQNIYQFNLRADILPLLDDKGMLIATNDNKYIMAVKSDINNLTKMENSIQLYLASINPDIKEKSLPDYTSIKQIVRQPEKYQFKTEEINGITLHYVADIAEFGYFYRDNLLILANSIQKLKDLVINSNLISVASLSSCKLPNQEFLENSHINSQFLANYKQYFKSISIAAGLARNDKIWLCLE